jgi:multidrug efflux system outer membrane protein
MAVGRVVGVSAGLVLTVALAACASRAPAYVPPPLPVPDAYPAVSTSPATDRAPLPEWRDYFVEPRLQALIELALSNNRDLRGAVLRVEEARIAYRVRRAERWPVVPGSVNALHARVPDVGITGRAMETELIALGASVNGWELDFWGRVRSLRDADLETYLATDAARRAVTLSVITQVANGYLALRELDERLVLARRTLAIRDDSLRIFRRRVEVGATARLELTQVEVLWQQATALVAQLELARATEAHALHALMGVAADLAPVSGRLDETPMFMELQPGLPSDLLTRRPDIVAAEHALKAANANIGAARAAFLPTISLTGIAGLASTTLKSLFSAGSVAWLFMPSVTQPIFEGGRRQAALDLSEVRREQAIVRYEQVIQTAFRDVSDALSARHWLREQVRILGETLRVQAESARLAALRYDSGAGRYLEVLDAERELLAVEQQLVQTRRALLASHVALYAALGGGPLPASEVTR